MVVKNRSQKKTIISVRCRRHQGKAFVSKNQKNCSHFRPTVAGIHAGPKGAYSIALSGGYEDDIDMGDCFTYTGEGMFLAYILHCILLCHFRPPVMGIHAGPKGAYSIALSGGYEDDVDMGDCFTYTGEGIYCVEFADVQYSQAHIFSGRKRSIQYRFLFVGGRNLKGTKANPKVKQQCDMYIT